MPAVPTPLRRVRVVGCSGSGKSTFAARLAGALDVPHLELDAVFWDAGWTKRDLDEARDLLGRSTAHATSGWVADGSWEAGTVGLLDDADAVVWLDFPRRAVMSRVIRRTLRRGLLRTELWHGKREDLRSLLLRDPERNIVRWSWSQHGAYRARFEAYATEAPVAVVRLRSPREARGWLSQVTAVDPA